MPNVNGKKFAYTPSGIKAAKAYAKKTGAKLTMYAMGGTKIPSGKAGAGLRALKKSSPKTVAKMGYKKYGGKAKPKMGYGGTKKKKK